MDIWTFNNDKVNHTAEIAPCSLLGSGRVASTQEGADAACPATGPGAWRGRRLCSQTHPQRASGESRVPVEGTRVRRGPLGQAEE